MLLVPMYNFIEIECRVFQPFLLLSDCHSQTYFAHKEATPAQENRDYILGEMRRALKTIAVVVDGDDLSELNPNEVIVVPSAEVGEVERSLMFVEVSHLYVGLCTTYSTRSILLPTGTHLYRN